MEWRRIESLTDGPTNWIGSRCIQVQVGPARTHDTRKQSKATRVILVVGSQRSFLGFNRGLPTTIIRARFSSTGIDPACGDKVLISKVKSKILSRQAQGRAHFDHPLPSYPSHRFDSILIPSIDKETP